jgi:RNA polymerase sigma factor (sigma-70 family)
VAVRSAVLGALRELPAKQRAAVVLRYLDDLPVHEVAAALGCSEGTVKSNASRGLDRLRQVLGPSLIPEGVEL